MFMARLKRDVCAKEYRFDAADVIEICDIDDGTVEEYTTAQFDKFPETVKHDVRGITRTYIGGGRFEYHLDMFGVRECMHNTLEIKGYAIHYNGETLFNFGRNDGQKTVFLYKGHKEFVVINYKPEKYNEFLNISFSWVENMYGFMAVTLRVITNDKFYSFVYTRIKLLFKKGKYIGILAIEDKENLLNIAYSDDMDNSLRTRLYLAMSR